MTATAQQDFINYRRSVLGLSCVPVALIPSMVGVSRQRVNQLISQGRFDLVRYKGMKFVPIDQIERHWQR